jgi:hypothetical protein
MYITIILPVLLLQSQSLQRSKADRFRDQLADLLNTERENVDVFSVQLRRKHPPVTDIRFAAHGSPYFKPVRLNGLVLMHREEVSRPKIPHIFLQSDYL